MNLKPLLKTGIVAAAVILIGLALLLNTPTAKAVTIDQIYKAIEKVKNVYISSFILDKKKPIQELWVSRKKGIYISKTAEQLVLCDTLNSLRKSKDSHTGVIDTAQLTEDDIAGIKQKMSGSLGLMPFYNISEIPKDAEWSQVTDGSLKATAEGTEVYDLKWADDKASDGSVVFKKWRVFVDSRKKLPQRTEFYEKSLAGTKYDLKSVKEVGYRSDSEIRAVIKDASF